MDDGHAFGGVSGDDFLEFESSGVSLGLFRERRGAKRKRRATRRETHSSVLDRTGPSSYQNDVLEPFDLDLRFEVGLLGFDEGGGVRSHGERVEGTDGQDTNLRKRSKTRMSWNVRGEERKVEETRIEFDPLRWEPKLRVRAVDVNEPVSQLDDLCA